MLLNGVEYLFLKLNFQNGFESGTSSGFEPVLSLTEKSCIVSYFKHFAEGKTGINLITFHFTIRGKVYAIR